MTMMLVARALERIGDNAVDIGEQVAFVVTGLFREFEDASHPGQAPLPSNQAAGRSRATRSSTRAEISSRISRTVSKSLPEKSSRSQSS